MSAGEPIREARASVWLAVAAAAALFVLRNPWALAMPQFWAEEGNPFLVDSELHGFSSILRPYAGYLHLIPRIVALLAGLVRDCVWWPAIYSFAALAIAIGVLARMASPRLALPRKPLLILAFGVAAHSGEVLLNQANIQWISAFFLIQQLLMAPPVGRRQVAGDAMLAMVAGLTGPFSVLLAPLFVWRAARVRQRGLLVVAVVVLACAAVQAGTMLRSSDLPSGVALAGFDAKNYLAVLGNRLVVWPFFGAWVALNAPPAAIGAVSLALFAGVVWQVAHAPPERRGVQAMVLLVLVVMLFGTLWRARPDAWDLRTLELGDRYFFIARILFAWLVIWQLDAMRRSVALAAAALCILAVLTDLLTPAVAAPRDLHWAQQCGAIVAGRPAVIPILPEGMHLYYPGQSR